MTAQALLHELTLRGVTLWVDADRLRYRAARDVLTGDLLEAMHRHRNELVGLLRAGAGDEFPLSDGQRGIWFLCREAPESTAYNIAFACRIVSAVDASALESALGALVERHASLRTTYATHDDAPVQRVHPYRPPTVERVDASGWSPARVAAVVHEACQRPFDLEHGPLLRMHLYATDEAHVLLLTLHHLTHDGWSLWLMLDELRELYTARVEARAPSLAPPGATYRDFVRWQGARLGGNESRHSLAYWRRRLAGPLPALALPTDRPRPAARSDRGASLPFRLDVELTRRLRALAQAEGATLYMLLLAAFQTLLHRESGQEDVVVGSPVSGREGAEFSGVVGYFINQVAMRGDLSGDPPFTTLLDQVRRRTLEALEHGDYPFTRLVDALGPEREPGRTPIFQTTFALQRPHRFEAVTDLFVAAEMGLEAEPGRRVRWGALELAPYVLRHRRAWFDLTVQMMDVRDVLVGSFSYSADLFDATTVERLATHYRTLLAAIVDAPASPLSRLALLDPAEALARRAASLVAEFPAPRCLHQLFEAQAARRPEAVALVGDDTVLTYGALDASADRLARRLRAHGIGPESIVGVHLDRSPALVVAILAVLKAGGAYLPLDPAYPPERLALMLEDSGAALVVTSTPLAPTLPAGGPPRVLVDEAGLAPAHVAGPRAAIVPANLAYVIYTSGSTGRPKGVPVSHASVVRLFAATDAWLRPGEDDVWTLFHSASFDFSVWEMWGALLHGGRLVIVPRATSRSPHDFATVLVEQGVTVLNQTPTAFYQLIPLVVRAGPGPAATLRHVIFGGEALDPRRLRPWVERFGDGTPRLVNMYGITETTVHVTYRSLEAGDCERVSSRIGAPLADLATWTVDRHLALVPFGVPGEICVGGAGVARGYLGRPALTAERFVPDPFGARPGGRLYRSGDLARAFPGGDLEYLARADQQVKIRGFRIEPGEIEAALELHPAVRVSCVAALTDDGDAARLVAYVVPDAAVAAPIVRALSLERERALDPAWLHELPNGLTVAHLNRAETAFLYEEIFEGGSYLRHGIRVEDGDCVFDVGANIGLFPVALAAAGRRVKVYAFEPIPPVFARLSANCRVYGVDAELFACALGAAEGRAAFTYYPNASVLSGRFADPAEEARVVEAYLRRRPSAVDGGDGDTREMLADLLEERLESRPLECDVRTLSSVIAEHRVKRIDLLKIDVEKSELDVLEGITAEDWKKIEQVVIEVHDVHGRLRAVAALLATHGFRPIVEQDPALAGTGLFSVYATRRASVAAVAEPALPARLRWSGARRLVGDLRAHLKARLPDHMVPAALVLLPALPMTANGKIDRRALPAPEPVTAAPGFVAARTAAERTLAEVWARVLRLERVGVTDNFFELGGDSILSIAVATRAQDAGLRMVSRQLFQHQTIAELAAAVAPATPPSDATRVAGPVPATPVQRWLFERALAAPHHFNQSLVLELPVGTTREGIARALHDLVEAHDALGLCVGPADELRILPPADVAVSLETIDDASESADRLQASLDLSRPPLLRAAWLDGGAGAPDRLLLIAHHLIVDAVSWRIIAEDLLDGHRRPPTTSFAGWSRRLRAFARSETVERELDFWLAPSRQAVAPMPVDRPDAGANTEGSTASLGVTLGTDVVVAARGQLLEVLLAALLQAWQDWTGDARLHVDLEGHGREELFDGVDLSRTVGWFTTIFPVLLEADGRARSSPSALLQSVRDQLRRVPGKGLGYGVLRYLRDDDVAERLRRLPSPEIRVNYLGRLDGGLTTLVQGGRGRNTSPLNRRAHRLEVDAFVAADELHVRWTFSERLHHVATVERLAASHRDAIRQLTVGQLRKLSRVLEERR